MISVILQACIQGNYYLFTEAITELIVNFMKTFLVEPILRIGSLNTSFEYLTKFEVQLFHTLILLMNYVNDIHCWMTLREKCSNTDFFWSVLPYNCTEYRP